MGCVAEEIWSKAFEDGGARHRAFFPAASDSCIGIWSLISVFSFLELLATRLRVYFPSHGHLHSETSHCHIACYLGRNFTNLLVNLQCLVLSGAFLRS